VQPNYVENYPYHQGLLASYWDESQPDNNTGEHPGSGLTLSIDSHPYPMQWTDGTVMRTRIQVVSTDGHTVLVRVRPVTAP
jgi:immune inhibitor A